MTPSCDERQLQSECHDRGAICAGARAQFPTSARVMARSNGSVDPLRRSRDGRRDRVRDVRCDEGRMQGPATLRSMRIAAGIAFATLVCVTVVRAAQSVDSRESRVDSLFAEWNKPDSPGCSVAVGKQGAVVLERVYGMANLELGVPIRPACVFGAAAISKAFTALSIMLLAQRGR